MNVGELTIGLRADVAKLQTDMNAAKTSVQGAMKDIEQYVGYAKTAFIGLGGVLTVGAFTNFVSGAMAARAGLVDLSSQSGITVEALGALGKVGKYTDTALTDIVSASTKLSKALATQNEDSKGAAQAITALGLNFTAFKSLKPEEQLLAVAKAMAEFKDGSNKTADAMLLFGKTGATLLPFLRDLAEKNELVGKVTTESALQAKQYEKNIKDLVAIGDTWKNQLVTGISPALVRVTKDLIDGRKAYGGWLAATIDIGLNVSPFNTLNQNITETINQYRELEKQALKIKQMQASGGLLGKLLSGGENVDGLKRIREEQALLDKRLTYLRAQQLDGSAGGGRGAGYVGPKPDAPDPGGGAGGADDKKNKLRDDYTPLIRRVEEMAAASTLDADAQEKATAARKLAVEIAALYSKGLIQLTGEQLRGVDAKLKAIDATQRETAAKAEQKKWDTELWQQQQSALEVDLQRVRSARQETEAAMGLVTQYGRTRQELEALADARLLDAAAQLEQKAQFNGSTDFADKQSQAWREEAQQLRELAAARRELNSLQVRDQQDPLAGARLGVKAYLSDINRAGDATRAAVENSLRGLEDSTMSILGGGNARQVARQWVNGLISEMQRLYVVKPLLASIFGGSGDGGGGLFSSLLSLAGSYFGGGSANASGSGSFASLAGISGGRASGGPVDAGKSYLVGERGPEIVRMGSAGNVVPNSALGGGPVNIQVVNNTGTSASAKANQLDDGTIQLILEKMEDRVAGSIAGGGKVGAAMSSTFQLNRAGSAPRY